MNNTSTPSKVMHRYLAALGLMAVLLAATGLAVILGPIIEARFWPVLTDVHFHVLARNEQRMTLDWEANKQRHSCVIKAVSAIVRRGEHLVAADLSPAGDESDSPLPLITRPPGPQHMRRMDVIPSGSAIALTIRHECHLLWTTVTNVKESPLP